MTGAPLKAAPTYPLVTGDESDFPVSDGRCVHCGQFTSQRESWRNDEHGWTIGYCKRCASWVETEFLCWESDCRP